MSDLISITTLEPAEAVAVTKETHSLVEQLTAERGPGFPPPPVAAATTALNEAAQPLAVELPGSGYENRRTLDLTSDRVLTSIFDQAETVAHAYEQSVVPLDQEQQRELEASAVVRDVVFKGDISFTRGRWSVQYGTTEMILQRSREPEAQAAIDVLALAPRFRLAGQLHALYGKEMGFDHVGASALANPLQAWREALENFVAAVVFSYKPQDPLRELLLGPYQRMARAVREARAKKSKKKE